MSDLHTLALAAAELVDAIGDQAARDTESFTAGQRDAARLYPVIFEHGIDVGYMRADRAHTARWAPICADVAASAGQRSHAELARRRANPGGPAYYAQILTHGGTQYGGASKPRVPVPPAVLAAAQAWAAEQEGRAARD